MNEHSCVRLSPINTWCPQQGFIVQQCNKPLFRLLNKCININVQIHGSTQHINKMEWDIQPHDRGSTIKLATAGIKGGGCTNSQNLFQQLWGIKTKDKVMYIYDHLWKKFVSIRPWYLRILSTNHPPVKGGDKSRW